MRVAIGISVVGMACLLFAASGAFASAWIEISVTPTFPTHLDNPGGTLTATCVVHPEGPESGTLNVSIVSPMEETVFEESLPGALSDDLSWTVPGGLDDGIYRYRVEYTPDAGPATTAEGEFFMAGQSTGICAFKIIDKNANGEYDPGIDSLATGWQVCVEPGLGCKVTTGQYASACWFFISPGLYQVCETMQPGFIPITPACQTVDVAYRQIVEVDFYNAPAGACCFPDGHCEFTFERDCGDRGGVYQGDFTDCASVQCPPPPPPTGACCYHPGGACQVLTQAQCLATGGSYEGDDVPCISGLCSPTATEMETWGKVKHVYR